jgi:hypothetical protein
VSRTLTILLPDSDEISSLADAQAADLILNYNQLKKLRKEIEQSMQQVRIFLQGHGHLKFPEWHCRRCGNDWVGRVLPRPPRVCPRCGSVGWQEDPSRAGSRKPSDPPNPRWGATTRKRPVTTPATNSSEVSANSEGEKTLVERERRISQPDTSGGVLQITPPPRFEPAAPAAPALVPSQAVRFGEEPKVVAVGEETPDGNDGK